MKIFKRLRAILMVAALLITSGCGAVNYSSAGAEPIDWREYNDC